MVQLRAFIHGVPPSRATSDVDAAVTISRKNGESYLRLAALLSEAGFKTTPTHRHAYRFKRAAGDSTDVVDLMYPDGIHPDQIPRFKGRPVFSIPGGRRAVTHREHITLERKDGLPLALYVPSLRDSLVLKGAAYLGDGRDKGRHLSDAITLLACVERPKNMHTGLSRRSKKRVRALLRGLEQEREPWLEVNPVTRDLATLVLPELLNLFDIHGTMNPERYRKAHG